MGPGFIFKYWQKLKIASKFATAFGILQALIIIVGLIGLVALTAVLYKTETTILTSSEIQRTVLSMNHHIEESRRLQRDFSINYMTLVESNGEQESSHQIQDLILYIMQENKNLQQLISNSNVSEALRKNEVNMKYFHSSSKRYLNTFREIIALYDELAGKKTGLMSQLSQHSMLLNESLEKLEDSRLLLLFKDVKIFENQYWHQRKRFLFQSAFNILYTLRQEASNKKIISHIENYESTARKIVNLEVSIRSKLNEFDLQIETIAPISTELILLAQKEVENARSEINRITVIAIVVLLIVILCGFVLISLISTLFDKTITRNVVKLTNATNELKEDNLLVTTDIDSNDEVGLLGKNFNGMALRVQNLVTNLEEQVIERTGAEEKFRSIFENAVEGIYQSTLEGRFLSINPSMVKMLGYDSAEDIMSSITDIGAQCFVNPGARTSMIQTLLDDGTIRGFETRMRKKDSSIIWCGISARLVKNFDGSVRYSEGFCVDITKQKLSDEVLKSKEAQLQRSQKMETIGILTGGIAHEFNNILYIISGTSELLMLDAKPDEKENISGIINASQRGAKLVKQLMAFSRKTETSLYTIQLNTEMPVIIKMIEQLLPRMIDIRHDFAHDLHPINADKGQIEQVVLNLCLNAKDAMPDGGTLSIKTENGIVDDSFIDRHPEIPIELHDNRCVIMTVSDTGTGMDEKTKEHIFDPFFTTKDVGKGTGLGLSVIYGIIKGHDGHIYCDSKPGAGTAFKIYFPAVIDNQTEEMPKENEPEQLMKGTETILIVDDEKDIVSVMETLLRRLGYTTLSANTGESALTIYKKMHNKIDLVLLDFGMPGMGGKKTLDMLFDLYRDVKVIVASGYSGEKAVEDIRKKAKAFTQKPVNSSKLLKLIRNVLDMK